MLPSLVSLLKRVLGYGGSSPPTHTGTHDLSRCHAAGLASCRAGEATGWSGDRRPAATSRGTNCCKCTRLSSRRPKTPSAGPGGASPGTVKPLHAAALFPIKPCKQERSAGVIGSWGAESRDTPYRAGMDVAAGLANDGIAHLSLRGQLGPPTSPRRAGMPRDHAGALRIHRVASPSPAGLCHRRLQRGELVILGSSWAGSGGAGSQPFLASVTRALSPLQLLTPQGTALSIPPAPPRCRFPSAGPRPIAFQQTALQPSSSRACLAIPAALPMAPALPQHPSGFLLC